MLRETRRCPKLKKYIVRLNDQEREELRHVVMTLSGTSQKVKRAQVLLKADVDGPAWTDSRIADAFGCRTKTIENIRQRLVEQGFRETLDDKQRAARPTAKVLRAISMFAKALFKGINE